MNIHQLTLVTALDDSYVIALAAMIASLLENSSKETHIELFVVADQLTAKNKKRVESMVENKKMALRWVDLAPSKLQGLFVNFHSARAAYARLYLDEILPKNVKKVIYLDPDLLILDDLYELWQVNFEGDHICACQSPVIRNVSHPLGVYNYKDLGFSEDATYFNSGVLLVDMEKWRSDKVGSRALDYVRRSGPENRLWDQGALNAILCNKWKKLDRKWNACSRSYVNWQAAIYKNEIEACGTPGILHFLGNLKPWKFSGFVDPKERGLFFKYLSMTPWKMSVYQIRLKYWLEQFKSWLRNRGSLRPVRALYRMCKKVLKQGAD